MSDNPEKINVLWLSDFASATGFAQVAHNIIAQLQKTNKYTFTVIGINHHGEPYDFHRWPFPIYPARLITKIQDPRYADLYGRQRLLDELGSGKYDIVFTLQDTFIMEEIAKQIVETKKQLVKVGLKPFQWIFYYPIDSEAKENWITDAAALADFPVTYTKFAENITHRYAPGLTVDVVYHGTNVHDFKPMPEAEVKAFRERYFQGRANGKFLVTNVNRNQRRKDIPRTIAVFAEFHRRRPDTFLYLHLKPHDVGGDVLEMARHYGLEFGTDFLVPTKFDENVGLPIEAVNMIYNASDCIMSTTLGEGWGLSSTEAMATKTPVVFPDNTSLTEILGEGRGLLAKCGTELNDFICLGAEDMNQFRPMTDVESMVSQLEWLYDHKDSPELTAMTEKAFAWTRAYSWEEVGKRWITIFERASTVSPDPQSVQVGRNEPCPQCAALGITRKWKKCAKHNPEQALIKVAV